MKNAEVCYLGSLRTEALHISSGNKIVTDAPIDNNGKGEAFSPTDLLATSLGSCMLTIMGIIAECHNINIVNAKVEIIKIIESNPRRVVEIKVDIEMPKNDFTDKEKQLLEHAARNCPVAKSLHPDLKQTVVFNY